MSTSENPLYSLPSSPFPEAFWTSSNFDVSPETTQDDNSLKLDPTWQSPDSSIYSLPDYYFLPLGSWSDQCTTPLSTFSPLNHPISTGVFSDRPIDVTNWVTPPNTFTAPLRSAFPTGASPCAPDLTPQCNQLQDSPSQQSCATVPISHSSPAEPSHNVCTTPIPSAPSDAKPNRIPKAPIRCWEHSCAGRAFSSLGNYERHLREKSGRAKSFACEQCGQRFTRSTAKNKHIRYGRCRVRPVE